MMAATLVHTPRELVELWSSTAAERLRSERAAPGQITGTELNRLGELVISAASWLAEDTAKTKVLERQARVAAMKRSPAYAALTFAERIAAEVNA